MTDFPKIPAPTAWIRLMVQVAALLVSMGGAVYNLKSDISSVQFDIAGLKQKVLDTQSDVDQLRSQVQSVTDTLIYQQRH